MGGIVISKEMVREALAELRVNRPRYLANRHIRNLLRTYGGGATSIGDLAPDLYFAVFVAAGGLGPVCAPRQRARVVEPPAPAPRSRIRSPITVDLERRLAERAGKPRSKPNYAVNIGSPSHVGDQADDVAQDFPAGERIR